MAKFFCTAKLSENISKTPEGYLLCKNVPIGRTGVMEYGPGETPLEVGDDGVVYVSRTAEELFRPQTIASFEGKSVTIRHPEEFVNPNNWKELTKGTLHNIRQADEVDDDGEEVLLADVLVTDHFAIGLVENGLREVSCGYEAEYEQTGPGKGKQTNIVGNHLALVEQGRAGATYAIRDSKRKGNMKEYIRGVFRLMSGGKTIDQAMAEMKRGSKTVTKVLPGKGKDGKRKGKSRDEGAVVEKTGAKTEVLHEMPTVDEESRDELQKIYDAIGAMLGKSGDEGEEEESEDEDVEQESHVSNEGKDESEEQQAKEDEQAANHEERLKALEAAVSKLLESKDEDESKKSEDEDESEKSEDEDDMEESEDEDESEKSEDEEGVEGNEKGKKTGDAALAEILVPDFEKPKKGVDIKKAALKQAMRFTDTASLLTKLNGGKKPTFDNAATINVLFHSAAAIMKQRRGTGLEGSKSVTTAPVTFETADLKTSEGMTAEKLNELNAQHYAGNK